MHAGRRLPNSLILLLLAGCTTPRYVGSIGRDHVYSNRGFGIAIRLAEINERWDPIDPSKLDRAPRKHRPAMVTELDVDGDGLLTVTEHQEHTRPTLRLLSRTSSTARMDIQVQILGGKNKSADLEALLARELKRYAGTSTAAFEQAVTEIDKRSVSTKFTAQVSELQLPDKYLRIALIDQGEVQAEEGIRRRQVVKVILTSDQADAAQSKDHDTLLDSVILNRRGGTETIKEKW